MLPLDLLRILLVAPILITAAAFLGASALVILRKSPLVIRASSMAWIVTLASAFLFLAALIFVLVTAQPAVCILFSLPALIVIGVWRSTRGYYILGATEAGVRASFQAALAGLGLPYEETILGFTLSSLYDDLLVRVQAPLGIAQFQMRSPGHRQELAQIAQGVKEQLRLRGEANNTAAAIYTAAGLVFLVLALYQAGRF